MRRAKPPRLVLSAALLLTLLWAGCRESMGPSVPLPESNPTQRYAAMLADVVTHDGYVDYDALTLNRGPLDEYVSWIANSSQWRLERPVDRPADYLNAYNALVLYQVLERNRPASVLDVAGWIPRPGAKFFATTQFKVGREWVSLSEIEHERVRNSSLDYRVHAAMNCASRSCPPMRREPYTRKAIGMQLREQMGRWINDDRGLYMDGETVVFSPIFDWFARDFHFWSAGQSPCEIARRYASGERLDMLRRAEESGCKHRFFPYDWSLNDVSVAEQ